MFENLRLRTKVLILLFISLAVVTALGIINTTLYLKQLTKAKETRQSLYFLKATDQYVHFLQRERGRSSMFVSGGTSAEDLEKFRVETNEVLKKFLEALTTSTLVDQSLAKNEEAELKRIRAMVDEKSDALAVVQNYTAHIERSLALNNNLIEHTEQGNLVRMFSSIALLEEVKEALGRLRAALSTHLSKNQPLNKEQLERMLSHKVAVMINLKSRSLILSDLSKEKLSSLQNGSEWTLVDNVFYKVLKNYEIGNYDQDPKAFFDSISKIINEFGEILKIEHDVVEKEISNLIDQSFKNACIVGILCSFVVLFSLVLLWFLNKNISLIINSLLEETRLLVDSAKEGKLTSRVNNELIHPEFQGITSGFNEVLNIVGKTFSEAMTVMEDVARKNLTHKMTGECAGDFLRFRENTNRALADLRETIGRVVENIEQINSGALQVAQMSQSLSQGAQQQAASLEEITSSVQEMSGRTKQTAESAQNAKNLSDKAKEITQSGNERMNQMLNSMNDIHDASQSISKIIKVIDEIAFQTNLLALNAAVEAARAGKHGKGFAVVAEEVRNLAARSAQAAKETTELIESTKSKVEQGVSIAKQTEESLKLIREEIERVTDIASEIAYSSQAQSVGINEVSLALDQIEKVTQSNSAAAEEAASSAEILSSQASDINKMVTQFKI